MPSKLKNARRTHTCGELRSDAEGAKVIVQGWVHNYRDFGGVVFLDLRDRHGVVQITCDERVAENVRTLAGRCRQEYVLEVAGVVHARSNPNDRIATGQIEILPDSLEILTRCPPLPFSIENAEAAEDTRLQYRYLDLRRAPLQNAMRVRSKAAQAARRYLDGLGFLEIETPVLTRATPEGARDYLVPSRVHAGKWYALPQSPQIFKQILMISGFDRYFQIVKCFRDEDLRADRQPEFTQIDLEMSFASREMVMEMVQGCAEAMWQACLGRGLGEVVVLSYQESMARFGLDAPDLRFGMEHTDFTQALLGSESRVIQGGLADKGIAKAMVVKGGAGNTSRKVLDAWTAFVRRYGMGGLMWGKVNPDGWSGPLKKLLNDAERATVGETLGAQVGDVVLLGVGPANKVHAGMGRLRAHIGKQRGLTAQRDFAFCWVVDFPAFEYDEEEGRWYAMHHPFTAPKQEHMGLMKEGRLGEVYADAYDLVCNGYEITGGSIRIHQPEIQSLVFDALGMSKEEATAKFGFLLDALQYAPPHGGAAMGFDRLCMLLVGTENIRDVIAFPKTASAQDLMSGAPSLVEADQLAELKVANTSD
jgi:aspartyl-tRNA synthetase